MQRLFFDNATIYIPSCQKKSIFILSKITRDQDLFSPKAPPAKKELIQLTYSTDNRWHKTEEIAYDCSLCVFYTFAIISILFISIDIAPYQMCAIYVYTVHGQRMLLYSPRNIVKLNANPNANEYLSQYVRTKDPTNMAITFPRILCFKSP